MLIGKYEMRIKINHFCGNIVLFTIFKEEMCKKCENWKSYKYLSKYHKLYFNG